MTALYGARDIVDMPAPHRPRRLARARIRRAAMWLLELLIYAAGFVTLAMVIIAVGAL